MTLAISEGPYGERGPSAVQGHSSWSGGQEGKALWSWNTFGFWKFNGSCKFDHF